MNSKTSDFLSGKREPQLTYIHIPQSTYTLSCMQNMEIAYLLLVWLGKHGWGLQISPFLPIVQHKFCLLLSNFLPSPSPSLFPHLQVVCDKLGEMDILIHRLLDIQAELEGPHDTTPLTDTILPALSVLMGQFTQVSREGTHVSHIHAHMHTHPHVHTQCHIHTHTYVHMHANTRTRIHMHTPCHIHTVSYTHTHTYTHTYITHTHTHTNTHTYPHTNIQSKHNIHKNTHTHTHRPSGCVAMFGGGRGCGHWILSRQRVSGGDQGRGYNSNSGHNPRLGTEGGNTEPGHTHNC